MVPSACDVSRIFYQSDFGIVCLGVDRVRAADFVCRGLGDRNIADDDVFFNCRRNRVLADVKCRLLFDSGDCHLVGKKVSEIKNADCYVGFFLCVKTNPPNGGFLVMRLQAAWLAFVHTVAQSQQAASRMSGIRIRMSV